MSEGLHVRIFAHNVVYGRTHGKVHIKMHAEGTRYRDVCPPEWRIIIEYSLIPEEREVRAQGRSIDEENKKQAQCDGCP